jgi:hypothetical protein
MQYREEDIDADGTSTVTLYDTTAGTVTVTVDGVQTEQRAITPDEVQRVEALGQMETETTNTTQMVAESDEAVDKLVAVVEALNLITDMTNAEINANPAAVIKDVARELKTVARQVNREARLTSGRTEDTDTGPVTDV